jgi:tryptophan halogenase
MLLREIGLLVRAFPLRRRERVLADLFNRKVGAFWDYLRWFLALHYRFNRRLDSPFWRCCREEVDVSRHEELLRLFRDRGPLSCDAAARAAFDYPDPLWGPEGIDVLLLGQGVPCRLPPPALPRADFEGRVGRARAAVARALPQERALAAMAADPSLLEPLADAFREVGPAFPVSVD